MQCLDKQLIAGLAASLGEKTRIEGTTLHAIVQRGDAWFATRIRTEPVAEIFIATRPLDGFELAVHWGDRWRDPKVGEALFDNTFGLQTNDVPLMRSFLDGASRDALLGSIYDFAELDVLLQEKHVQRTWTYELANDQLVVTKGSRELDVELFMRAILAGCSLAGRSQRWAIEYADLARAIGGTAAAEVEIGGGPVVSATRSAVDVAVRVVRRVGRVERLRTIVAAPRIGSEGTLSVVCDQLPKDARPELPDGDRRGLELGDYRMRASSEAAAAKLDDLAKKLVAIAQPAVIVVDTDSVEVWFDGAPSDPARLDPAVALVARLAVDAVAAQGPYR
jgi:hypothetical protein